VSKISKTRLKKYGKNKSLARKKKVKIVRRYESEEYERKYRIIQQRISEGSTISARGKEDNVVHTFASRAKTMVREIKGD